MKLTTTLITSFALTATTAAESLPPQASGGGGEAPYLVADGTCSEASGVCVCAGDACPSFTFTSSWAKSTMSVSGVGTCVAAKNPDSVVDISGDGITVDGKAYNPPYEACPGETGDGGETSAAAGDRTAIGCFFQLLVGAAAVVGAAAF